MALLRRGSSKISEENFNCRLQREKAKAGEITASLAWNDASDLDLDCVVHLAAGGKEKISYRNKSAAGGVLDVDMHANDQNIVDEPVENIYWKEPPAGVYSVGANLYKKRGPRESISFRAMLKRQGEDPLSVEGALQRGGRARVECFRFTVDEDGAVKIGKANSPKPAPTLAPTRAAKAKAKAAGLSARAKVAVRAKAKAASAKAKAKAKRKAALAKAKAKVRAKAKAQAAKAKAKAKAKAAKAKAKAKAAKAKARAKLAALRKGKKAKVAVYKGKIPKTKKGLKKEDLIKSKGGKIVSVKKSQLGKESKWAKATAKARAAKGYTGFKAIKKGGSFYDKAKEFMASA